MVRVEFARGAACEAAEADGSAAAGAVLAEESNAGLLLLLLLPPPPLPPPLPMPAFLLPPLVPGRQPPRAAAAAAGALEAVREEPDRLAVAAKSGADSAAGASPSPALKKATALAVDASCAGQGAAAT